MIELNAYELERRLAAVRKGPPSKPHIRLVPQRPGYCGFMSLYICGRPDLPYGQIGAGENFREAWNDYAEAVADEKRFEATFDLLAPPARRGRFGERS